MQQGSIDPAGATVLVTGAAGFIGYHVSAALLACGARVVGIDTLTDYYDPSLKRQRLEQLGRQPGFSFHATDITDLAALRSLPGIDTVRIVIHLAAQAGVRYSIDNPLAFGHANMIGQLTILELCRTLPSKPRLVYASSSSVYGGNTKVPFSEDDPVEHPVSLYAATKRAAELLSQSYAKLYGMPLLGLRFFTVYGPWGRPDMAYWSFTRDILEGKPIAVFNEGRLQRDFTYIDDIVGGVLAVALEPTHFTGGAPHRIYNIGNNQPVPLMRFIELIERYTGREAVKVMKPMQPGDVPATHADISRLAADYDYAPNTPLEVGLQRFVEWYMKRHAVK